MTTVHALKFVYPLEKTLKTDLEALAPLGTASKFKFLSGPPEGTFADDQAQHFGKSVAVRVSDIYTRFTHNQSLFSKDFKKVFELLEQGIDHRNGPATKR